MQRHTSGPGTRCISREQNACTGLVRAASPASRTRILPRDTLVVLVGAGRSTYLPASSVAWPSRRPSNFAVTLRRCLAGLSERCGQTSERLARHPERGGQTSERLPRHQKACRQPLEVPPEAQKGMPSDLGGASRGIPNCAVRPWSASRGIKSSAIRPWRCLARHPELCGQTLERLASPSVLCAHPCPPPRLGRLSLTARRPHLFSPPSCSIYP